MSFLLPHSDSTVIIIGIMFNLLIFLIQYTCTDRHTWNHTNIPIHMDSNIHIYNNYTSVVQIKLCMDSIVYYSGGSDKGPSNKRTTSLERTVYNLHFHTFFTPLFYGGQNGWSQCVLYSEVPLYIRKRTASLYGQNDCVLYSEVPLYIRKRTASL